MPARRRARPLRRPALDGLRAGLPRPRRRLARAGLERRLLEPAPPPARAERRRLAHRRAAAALLPLERLLDRAADADLALPEPLHARQPARPRAALRRLRRTAVPRRAPRAAARPVCVRGFRQRRRRARAVAPHAWMPAADDAQSNPFIPRLAVALWEARIDLRQVFPALRGPSRVGFARWLVSHDDQGFGADLLLRVHASLRPPAGTA